MKLGHYTIKDYTEETYCEWCGMPLYPGRKAYYDINDDAGSVYCSQYCALKNDRAAEIGSQKVFQK